MNYNEAVDECMARWRQMMDDGARAQEPHRIIEVDDLEEGLVGVTTRMGHLAVDLRMCSVRPKVGEISAPRMDGNVCVEHWIGGRRYQ